jgi:hypothetical protein
MEQNHSPNSPRDAAIDAVASFTPAELRPRMDGWTPERQRLFCETLADCGLVREAAAAVGMSAQSAYQLRRRTAGRAFAMAWDAALFLARQRLIDMALERAVDGNTETLTKDGEVLGEKSKKDVRHLLATITKLETSQNSKLMASTVADEFEEFLDCMEADANRAFAVAAVIEGEPAKEEQPAASRAAEFLAAREPDDMFGRLRTQEAVRRLSRRRTYSSRDPFEHMAQGFTPETLDDWDEIMEWEAEERAGGGVSPISEALAAQARGAK